MKTKRTKLSSYHPRRVCGVLAIVTSVAWLPAALAQTTAKPTDKAEEDADIVQLSPFEVSSTKDQGYTASSSLAG